MIVAFVVSSGGRTAIIGRARRPIIFRSLDDVGESVEIRANARQRATESAGGGDNLPILIASQQPDQLPYPRRDDSERGGHGRAPAARAAVLAQTHVRLIA